MQWILIALGLALLAGALLVTWLLHRRSPAAFARAIVPRRIFTMMKQAATLPGDSLDIAALADCTLMLMAQLHRLRRRLGGMPSLPEGDDGEPRLLSLAHDTVDAGVFTSDALLEALQSWGDSPLPSEVSAFPVVVGAAQCQRLALVLKTMLTDGRIRLQSAKLAARLPRSRKPYALLDKAGLNSLGLAALARALRQQEQPEALVLLDRWLEVHDLTAEDLARQDAQRQLQLAEEIRRAVECFSALEKLPWNDVCEAADALHPLLMKDPAGVYPDMDAPSRLALRLQAERFSRRTRMDAGEIIRHALMLCEDAEPRALERYVGYYLQDAQGMAALHRTLPIKRGRLYARFSLRRELLRRCLLWVLGASAGFAFLQLGAPVWMLPFFLLVAGDVIRLAAESIRDLPLPRLTADRLPSGMRILVMLPVLLHDSHEAIRMVRLLKTAGHAFHGEQAEYLLLGDFAPSMTAISSGDGPIVQSALAAVSALQEEMPIHYIQRGRVWNSDRHAYCAGGGRLGAIQELCRLIVQGESGDMIAAATLSPATLERRYDYVLVLSPEQAFYPGMLGALLRAMAHPLGSRYPTGQGWRGFATLSPWQQPLWDGTGLLRPDAYLEATDGLANPAYDSSALCGELAGHAVLPDAPLNSHPPRTWEEHYHPILKAWRLLPWQLPWVKTPAGVVNNPLSASGRFHLREKFRRRMLPLGRFVLLMFALLIQSWPLLCIALFAPELRRFSLRRETLLQSLCRLVLLPTQALLTLLPLWHLLPRSRGKSPVFPTLEVWAQGLAATIFAALGLAMPPISLPALTLAAAFACFPLAHRIQEAPARQEDGLTADHLALLEDIAASTWRYFDAQTKEAALLPRAVQFEPGQITEPVTTPEAIGAQLLALLCAKELGFLSAEGAAGRIQRTLVALQELPMPFGLPCREYALPALTVSDPQVSAAAVGFLAASLMTTAQALRTWLPELPPAFAGLSAEAENLLTTMGLAALYAPAAGHFHAGLDEDGQPTGDVLCFADDALLLLVAAAARKCVPADCLQRLRHTRVALDDQEVLLSPHGAASEQLLAGLFLPLDDQDAAAFIRAMQKAGREGVFGQGHSAAWRFDAQLRYQRGVFGLPAAIHPAESAPVYAPYAAALALPFLPGTAAEALHRFCTLGAKGPDGFCDAVDFTSGTALVGVHDAFHQGLILCAVAHLLADAPLRRYFCALPGVEACLPLLTRRPADLLPALPLRKPIPTEDAADAPPIDPLVHPLPVHLLGTADFLILADAHGTALLHDGAVPLNRSLHFYLADEGRVYRLGDPRLPEEIRFAPGELRLEQLCGSLRSELVICADTLRRRALHVLTITNLSTRDRTFELTDLLLPDLGVPATTLEPAHPANHRLTLHARGQEHTLHHTLDASVPPLRTTVCTDAEAFTGRGGSLLQPQSLEKPACDLLSHTTAPCLSFRARFALGGRGQVTLWFTTSLLDSPPPQLTELTSLRQLAGLQHRAIEASAALTDPSARRLIALLMQADWRVSLIQEDASTAVLAELLLLLGWMQLHGQPVQLQIHCPQEACEDLAALLPGTLAEEHIRFADAAESPSGLYLRGDLPLTHQLDSLYTPVQLPALAAHPPEPALPPRQELRHAGPFGGFDPDTSDYVLQLEPGQLPPAPWTNRHRTRHFQQETDEHGLHAPFGEQVWLTLPDGTLLSPWSTQLPRAVRMRPAETIWEAWSDQLDLRLRASCLPGHRCGLRSLSIHNATDVPLMLRITVLAPLGEPLTALPGLVLTDAPEQHLQSFLAGDGWQTRRVKAAPAAGVTDLPCLDLPDAPDGDAALLTQELILQPGRSGKVLWLAGFARHGEDVARALAALHASPASELFRVAQVPMMRPLSTLTFFTPEDTLDLLLNRILPLQALNADGIDGVPALKYLAPQEARRTLLRHARQPLSRDAWARLILALADYHRVTRDDPLLDVYLPIHDAPLLIACRRALLSASLTHQKLSQGEDSPRRCFLYALAAQALDALCPDPEALDFRRALLNAADTHLWQEGYYGTPLRLDVQALACAAYGANPRTRQAIATCWATLYDQPHGLIRLQEPSDIPPLPGLPENGGMVTVEAVRCLRALLKTAHQDEAFELLRALNPLHHTDTPERQSTFRCAPYQLPGGMCAAPMEAGRAIPGGDEAAAQLYALVLEDVLGLRRSGNTLSLKPCVPSDWEDFSLTLQEGASTWHISAERRVKALTIDGNTASTHEITLVDDGNIHHVRFPLA